MLETAETVKCPHCGAPASVQMIRSMSPSRHPELKAAILNNQLQAVNCGGCQQKFRLEPEFSYLDPSHSRWIAVFPSSRSADWKAWEKKALESFELIPPDLARTLQPRVVFGWHALKEKVIAADAGIDDVEIELMKLGVIRNGGEEIPISGASLRLVEANSNLFTFLWFDHVTQNSNDTGYECDGEILAHIRQSPSEWAELRSGFEKCAYVDLVRLLS